MKIFSLIASLVLAILPVSAHGQTATDFDGDQVSDILSVTAGSDLVWNSIGSTSAQDELNIHFGLITDIPVPAHWLDSETTSLAYVRVNSGNSSLVWKILADSQSIEEARFGKPGDTVIAGGDFNGDAITDAAVVRIDEGKIRWEVKYDLFSDPSKTRSFTLGKTGDRVLFLNIAGSRDCAAVFGPGKPGRSRLAFRDLVTKKTRTINKFPRKLSLSTASRPFPLAQEDGTDLLGFASSDESDTTIRVYTYRGHLVSRHIFPGLGTIVVGDFDGDEEGEEIAFQTATTRSIFNPVTNAVGSATVVTGTLTDEINIAAVGTAAEDEEDEEEE